MQTSVVDMPIESLFQHFRTVAVPTKGDKTLQSQLPPVRVIAKGLGSGFLGGRKGLFVFAVLERRDGVFVFVCPRWRGNRDQRQKNER